ncbi:MAG TPA: tetratricopeptide repeat protein [Thermoanaerobaculia bacterium]|jgi:tetratricopeptide (TPR) repeat protein|nr:tetratricopeptide repeat protein [Thermoanaerobaculia bacterium]
MTPIRRAAFTALLLALSLAGSLHAAGEGRIIATVVDDASGAPIEGAKVTLTRPGAGYRLEKTTDKKGQAQLLVLDATQDYQIRAEKAGYNPFEGPVKPKLSDTIRLTFSLTQAAPAPKSGPAELSGTDKAILAYNAGVEKLKAGDLAGALPKFEEAVKENPDLADAQGALAEVYLELKRNGDALAAADRYVALKPGDARGLRDRYDALKAAGDGDKAKEALEALRAADPTSPETAVRYFNEGAERTRSGQYDDAAVFFERVVEIAPDDPKFAKAHYVLGLSYAKDEAKKAQAREHLQKFLALAPGDSDAQTAKQMLDYLK